MLTPFEPQSPIPKIPSPSVTTISLILRPPAALVKLAFISSGSSIERMRRLVAS